uniref:UBL3-like ubiquitin domain-containing protein n=1 Tax=Trichobilharzia regenti TaxID=157069 RepID=A0AA85IUJ6_TRIRE|nr:unnamed protein product [Trichobilharzia regenti]
MTVHLKLLMPDGSFYENDYDQSTTVEEITSSLFKNWPHSLGIKPVSNHLKLIFQGRFLSGDLTLLELKLPPEQITMHLIQHETMPLPRINGQQRRFKRRCCRLNCLSCLS